MKEGILRRSSLVQAGQLPLAVDLLGCYADPDSLFSKLRAATDFAKALGIAEDLGEVPVLCNYEGVFRTGVNAAPTAWEPARVLGTRKELIALSELLKEHGGRLFLEGDQLLSSPGVPAGRGGDFTIDSGYQILKSAGETTRVLFTPEAVRARAEETVIPAITELAESAILEQRMGSLLYADYSGEHAIKRMETMSLWQDILVREKEALGALGVNEGGDYTFASADWIRNAPDGVSGYAYTDEAIPFYEMLVHGYLLCTSVPDNQFHDENEQFLHAVEYGFLPYYRLSGERAETAGTGIFTSVYEDVKPDLAASYNRYAGAVQDLLDVPVLRHERDGDLVTVTYEDGSVLLINYSGEDRTVHGVRVPSGDLVRIDAEKESQNDREIYQIREQAAAVAKDGEERISVYSPVALGLCLLLSLSACVFCAARFLRHHRS